MFFEDEEVTWENHLLAPSANRWRFIFFFFSYFQVKSFHNFPWKYYASKINMKTSNSPPCFLLSSLPSFSAHHHESRTLLLTCSVYHLAHGGCLISVKRVTIICRRWKKRVGIFNEECDNYFPFESAFNLHVIFKKFIWPCLFHATSAAGEKKI